MSEAHYDVAVVGAGIVGLAHAYEAAKRGKRVVLVDRNSFAVGASVRNFGLIWPIGKPPGVLLDRALRSRAVWLELRDRAGVAVAETGSIHAARAPDEVAVLQEFLAKGQGQGYDMAWLTPEQALARSPMLKPEGLLGALWSSTELTATSPLAIRTIPHYLQEAHGVVLRFGCAVQAVETSVLHTEQGCIFADRIIVASGPEVQLLFPQTLQDVTLSKLQMFSVKPADSTYQLGPGLCAGLTLLHYDAFELCTETLPTLKARCDAQYPQQRQWGIHVLISQHLGGELILGDSHEYGRSFDPFDRADINGWIMDYLQEFATLPAHTPARSWHGIYAKRPGRSELVADPLPGVTVVNALSGAGMTLSFGLAQDVLATRL